jgi:hypothetical protein
MERGDVAKQMAPRCAARLAVPSWVPLLAESGDCAIVAMPFIVSFYSKNDLDELRSVRYARLVSRDAELDKGSILESVTLFTLRQFRGSVCIVVGQGTMAGPAWETVGSSRYGCANDLDWI